MNRLAAAATRYMEATMRLAECLHDEFSCWDDVERFERSLGGVTEDELTRIKTAWEVTGGDVS